MKNKDIKIINRSTTNELSFREKFFKLFKDCPIPDNELLPNLGLFIKRQDMARILFMHELYKKIINVNGMIMEFGVRWGQNLALFELFRGIYEPFNYNRKIIGFDTFGGFPSIDKNDGKVNIDSTNNYSVTKNYEQYLEQILDYHEQESPIPHIKKYQLIKGDATIEIEKYLKDHPETIIALAYFDFDLYAPTKKCLQAIKGHITKGTVLGFDELNYHLFPGETIAFKEVFELDRYRIRRSPYNPTESYIVIE